MYVFKQSSSNYFTDTLIHINETLFTGFANLPIVLTSDFFTKTNISFYFKNKLIFFK